jgi:hypothetical protein
VRGLVRSNGGTERINGRRVAVLDLELFKYLISSNVSFGLIFSDYDEVFRNIQHHEKLRIKITSCDSSDIRRPLATPAAATRDSPLPERREEKAEFAEKREKSGLWGANAAELATQAKTNEVRSMARYKEMRGFPFFRCRFP